MPLDRLSRLARAISTAVALAAAAGCLAVMPAIAPSAKDVEANISADFPYDYEYVDVRGARMAYVEAGDPEGPPILLVHGNPTSAYLWRNVIPKLERSGRVIAVDLIGMGRSDKPAIDYRFADHAAYFAGFVEAMGLRNVTLVLHDWGGGVGFDYAARHEDNVRAIAFMEAVAKPMSLKEADLPTRYLFSRLRDPKAGWRIAAEDNYFVEKMLPMMSGRQLSEAEMAVYRAPYPTVESRRPVAQWPREIPLDGEPADNVARIGANFEWLRGAETPLLFLYGEPGMIFTEDQRDVLKRELPRMEMVSVGSGFHYLQEVQPSRIGEALAEWIDGAPASDDG